MPVAGEAGELEAGGGGIPVGGLKSVEEVGILHVRAGFTTPVASTLKFEIEAQIETLVAIVKLLVAQQRAIMC